MKNIVITGISRGLGYELYKNLSGKDYRLIGIGRTFRNEQNKILKMNKDLSIFCDYEGLGKLLDTREDIIFINNAGMVEPIGNFGTLSDKAFLDAAMVNFISPSAIINYLVKWSQVNKRNLKIIHISTGAAIRPISGWGSYCATKAAIKMFLDVLAEESKELSSVEIVQIDPGIMDTDMQATIRESEFSSVNVFRSYWRQHKLRKAADVACDIIEKYVKE